MADTKLIKVFISVAGLAAQTTGEVETGLADVLIGKGLAADASKLSTREPSVVLGVPEGGEGGVAVAALDEAHEAAFNELPEDVKAKEPAPQFEAPTPKSRSRR